MFSTNTSSKICFLNKFVYFIYNTIIICSYENYYNSRRKLDFISKILIVIDREEIQNVLFNNNCIHFVCV